VGYTITRTISFNITSIADEEDVSMAELRLFLAAEHRVFRSGFVTEKTPSVGVTIFDVASPDSVDSNGQRYAILTKV
jgi:hypothetical protein